MNCVHTAYSDKLFFRTFCDSHISIFAQWNHTIIKIHLTYYKKHHSFSLYENSSLWTLLCTLKNKE